MYSVLLILDAQDPDPDYPKFLENVAAQANKHEGIECLSGNVYMIPEGKFLSFVSAIAVLLECERLRPISHGGQQNITYRYKCLIFGEEPQWIHFDGSPG
jgi:hypothetical protein